MFPSPKAFLTPAAVVCPVPPFSIGKIPVTPGRGDACNGDVAVVLARFTNIEGAEVKPVPPLAIGNVPVTPTVIFAEPSKLPAVLLARFAVIVLAVASFVAVFALPNHFATPSCVTVAKRLLLLEKATFVSSSHMTNTLLFVPTLNT